MSDRRGPFLPNNSTVSKEPTGTRAEWRFLLLICLSTALVLLGFGLSVSFYTKQEQNTQTNVMARAFLMQTRRNISLWIDGEVSSLETVAKDADIIDAMSDTSDKAAMNRARLVLKNFHSSHAESYFISLNSLAKPRKSIVFSNSLNGLTLNTETANTEMFPLQLEQNSTNLPATHTYICTAECQSISGDLPTPTLVLSRQVEKDGRVLGLLSLGIRLDYLAIRFLHSDILGSTVDLVIANSDGDVLADRNMDHILAPEQRSFFEKILPLRFSQRADFQALDSLPNREVMVENIPVRPVNHSATFDAPWYLVLSKNKGVLLGGKLDYSLSDIMHLTLVALILMLTATLSIGAVFIRKIHAARTILENINLELEHSNYVDALTGLPNRKAYIRDMERLELQQNAPLGIVSFDVDGLKIINDMVGHIAGDLLLIDSASILKSVVRPPSLLYRTGGDEFIAVYPTCDIQEVESIRRKLNQKLDEFNVNRDENFMRPGVHISCGYAIREDAQININDLYQIADDKMYRYKRANNMSLRGKLLHLAEKALLHLSPHALKQRELEKQIILDLCAVKSEYIACKDALISLSKYHDIGKIAYSNGDGVLIADAKDTRTENQKIAETGFRIAMVFPQTFPIAHLILRQYEWWNDRQDDLLSGDEELPLESRLFAVIQFFATQLRRKSSELTHEQAVQALKGASGNRLDPEVVDLFIAEVLPKFYCRED